jgi:hypothetical protein
MTPKIGSRPFAAEQVARRPLQVAAGLLGRREAILGPSAGSWLRTAWLGQIVGVVLV